MLEPGPSLDHADARSAPALVSTGALTSVRPAAAPGELLSSWLAEAAVRDTSLQPRLLRLADGRLLPLHVDRWAGPVTRADETLLARARGPVLDVGCGPGRLTAALHRRGVEVLGLDVLAPVPVLARRAGARVHLASVFDPLPGEGTWGSVLLADGNVGIGGDAVVLLRRVRALLAPGGTVLCELEEDAPARSSERVRLEGLGCTSDWFAWALVGPDALPGVAAAAGLAVAERWQCEGRLFAALTVS
jgi:SAM-dependent methyltransferase